MGTEPVKPGTFTADVTFMQKHTSAFVLSAGASRVLVCPEYQGRVMTSTTGGAGDPSFGWLNYPVIAKGVMSPDEAKGRLEEHIYVFGGEERLWLGPEGGQYAIFFKPGAKFEFATWHTPPAIDTEPFKVERRSDREAVFTRETELVNNTGTVFKVALRRTVRILDNAEAGAAAGFPLPADVQAVGYETQNELSNVGANAWTQESGLLSIWMLGMYKPSPSTTVVIPFKAGPEQELGVKVNDTYFGKVPASKLVVKDDVLFFSGDGTHRSKIGISPRRSKGLAGSYDANGKVLTLVTYNQPDGERPYVNSMWEFQAQPYAGDAINAYNDGSPAPGQAPLGPFYEVETSSPAAALKPGESLTHRQRTLHIQGPESALDAVAKQALGVDLATIKTALKP